MVEVFRDYSELSKAAAAAIVAAGREAVMKRGRFDLVLSGGETPRRAYGLFAKALRGDPALAQGLHLYWSDERCVLPSDRRSNYRLAFETIMVPAAVPEARVHRIQGEAADATEESERYGLIFPAKADLVLLGLGEDGHTASLFPGCAALGETSRRFAASTAPVEPTHRITITPAGLSTARQTLVLVSGAGKAEALRLVMAAEGSVARTPARLVREAQWLVDKAAHSGIS